MGICRCTPVVCNDTCTTDVDHLVNVLQLEKLNDHGNLPVHHDRNVEDNDGLQLRRLHSFLQSEGRGSTSGSSLHVGKREILPKKPRGLMPNMYPLLNKEEC